MPDIYPEDFPDDDPIAAFNIQKQQQEVEARIRAACAAAQDFFKTEHGKLFYNYVAYDICHLGASCLDVDNAYRMAALCAQQEIGNRLRDIKNGNF